MTIKKRAVIYTRQSQAREDSDSHETQEQSCNAYAKAHGLEVVEVLSERGVSGMTITKRLEFQRAVKLIQDGKADTLLVWRWSRFARNTLDGLTALKSIQDAGGTVQSALEKVDNSAAGKFQLDVLLSVAEMESATKAETWRGIHTGRLEKGLPPGGGRLFGYDPVDASGNLIDYDLPKNQRARSKGYVVNTVQTEALKEMYKRALAGEPMVSIANWLNGEGMTTTKGNAWSGAVVRRLLENEYVTGKFHWKDLTYTASFPGIIPEATYRAFMAKRPKSTTAIVRNSNAPLIGIVKCGRCGGSMSRNTPVKNGTVYLRCSSKNSKGANHCLGVNAKYYDVQLMLNYYLIRHADTWAAALPQTDDVRTLIDALEHESEELTGKVKQLTEVAIATGLMDTLQANLTVLSDRLREIEREKDTLYLRLEESDETGMGRFIAAMKGLEDREVSPQEWRTIYRRVLERITLNHDKSVTFVPHVGDPETRRLGRSVE